MSVMGEIKCTGVGSSLDHTSDMSNKCEGTGKPTERFEVQKKECKQKTKLVLILGSRRDRSHALFIRVWRLK